MLKCHPNSPLEMPVSDHEEQIWLLQQQQPERLAQHLEAWRLDHRLDLARLSQAIQQLVEALPELNTRYHFSDEGDLHKVQIAGWQPCLEMLRTPAAEAVEQLLARRAAPWDAATQPPFKALIVATEQETLLALLLHPILDPAHRLSDLRDRLSQCYGSSTQQPGGLLLNALPLPPQGTGQEAVAELILGEFRSALAEPGMAVNDDFFDHGGHSLLATRIIGKLRGQHGVEIRFSDFFKSPTAAALAGRAVLSQASSGPAPGAQEVQQAPMALAQASLWPACAAYGFGTIFNLPFALDFLDRVDETLFQQAFTDLLERHASLRTTYQGEGTEACQKIVPLAQLGAYKWFWPSTESEGVALAAEAGHAFHLGRELPIRIRFLRDPQSGRQTLSLLVHHMAIDEWSLNTLMTELAQAYLARASDTAPAWAAPARSFHEFALRQHAQGVDPQHLAYWCETLRGATRGLQLPAPAEQPALAASQVSAKAQWLELRPAAGAIETLAAFARRHESSLFSVVYTAIALALQQLGQLKELVIGTSASGRTDPEFFDTVGYFTTLVAHRQQFNSQQTLGDLLGEITRKINDSMPYADVPMEQVQQALGLPAADGLLFDVYIQIHANNALNGALPTPSGNRIRYRQIDADKRESMFGLQFEIMEDVFEGQRSLRLVITYRVDRYASTQVQSLCDKIKQAFALFDTAGATERTLAEIAL